MKKKLASAAKAVLYTRLQFLPVVIFVLYAKIQGLTSLAWREAFMIGGALALLEFVYFYYKKWVPNPFISGVNLFLLVGGLAFITNNKLLLYYYKDLQQCSLFISLFIVGLIITFISRTGYIDHAFKSRKVMRKGSIALLTINVIAIALSYHFRGNFLYAGTIPLIMLIISQKMIIRALSKS